MDELAKAPLGVIELLCRTALCESKREARELLNAGAVTVNGGTCSTTDTVTPERLVHGRFAAILKASAPGTLLPGNE